MLIAAKISNSHWVHKKCQQLECKQKKPSSLNRNIRNYKMKKRENSKQKRERESFVTFPPTVLLVTVDVVVEKIYFPYQNCVRF